MNPRILLRLARLARQPMSRNRVAVIVVALLVVGALYGVEHIWGWPDWLTPNGGRGARLRRF